MLTKLFISCSLIVILSCKEESRFRQYKEIEIIPAQITASPEDPHAGHNHAKPAAPAAAPMENNKKEGLTWNTPEGWKEKEASGMRTAEFFIQSGSHISECTIIQLAGDAGGLVNNAKLWMQQLKMVVPGDKALNNFISKQKQFKTVGGFSGTFIDFTTMLNGNMTEDKSGLISVLEVEDQTVFVKMYGSKDLLKKNKDAFMSLCNSINLSK